MGGGAQEDQENGLGDAHSLSSWENQWQLTESRRGSIHNLVSLYGYNLYCEPFEMSCDLVNFPFFGAFAPCSDKQLRKTKT
jgi:hypothetical protein